MSHKGSKLWRKLTQLLLLLAFFIMLTACSSPVVKNAGDADVGSGGVMEERASMESAAPAQPFPQEAPDNGLSLNEMIDPSHKIIYSGEVIMETLEFDDTTEMIQDYVNRLGGYAESSYIEGRRITQTARENRRTASFTFRVPQLQFNRFREGLREYGNIVSSSTHGENITDRYFDHEARLTSLRTQEDRLLNLLERADNIEDILRIESELSSLRYQVESLTGTLQKWDNLVQFATLRVEIREVDEITPDPEMISWGTEIGTAFRNSVLAVIDTLQNLVILFISALPFIIVFVPLVWVGIKVYRAGAKRWTKHDNH